MRKIIHSKFELELSNLKLTDQDQNSDFSDSLFSKTTYPFDINLDDEMNEAFSFILDTTSVIETKFDVIYVHYDVISKAILEIIEINGRTASCTVEFGLEEFPSWEKKLSELSLEKFELPAGTTIYEHAEASIVDAWPDINYNFPQIHTDKIDTDDEVWFAFGKIINNRVDNEFLENDVDIIEDITYNRNIMQPLPYLLHVLQRGCADANLPLTGDILTDPDLVDQTIFADVDYFTTVTQESISDIIMSENFTQEGVNNGALYHKYVKIYPIPNPGKYRVKGDVNLYTAPNFAGYIKLFYRNTLLFSFSHLDPFPKIWRRGINVVFETLADLQPNEIRIEVYGKKTVNKTIVTLDINPIRLHDDTGTAIPTIINKNEVDLTRSVPDMTFGDLVKIIKNWYNYSFDVINGVTVMNKLKKLNPNRPVLSLQQYEVKYVPRKFQKGMSFLLKFADVDSPDYTFLPVFQNSEGTYNANYIIDEKTNTIEINALPLPVILRGTIQTAFAFESNNSKLYLVKYNGIFQTKNLSQDNSNLHLPIVHEKDWLDWMNFRINAATYLINFTASGFNFKDLKIKTELHAYNCRHLIKTLQKTEVSPDYYQYEIETESL